MRARRGLALLAAPRGHGPGRRTPSARSGRGGGGRGGGWASARRRRRLARSCRCEPASFGGLGARPNVGGGYGAVRTGDRRRRVVQRAAPAGSYAWSGRLPHRYGRSKHPATSRSHPRHQPAATARGRTTTASAAAGPAHSRTWASTSGAADQAREDWQKYGKNRQQDRQEFADDYYDDNGGYHGEGITGDYYGGYAGVAAQAPPSALPRVLLLPTSAG